MRQLIRLENGRGPVVEVEVEEPVARDAAAGPVIAVGAAMDAVQETLLRVCRPFLETWKVLQTDVEIGEASVTLGLGVTAEGNFFVAKGATEANLEVSIKFVGVRADRNEK